MEIKVFKKDGKWAYNIVDNGKVVAQGSGYPDEENAEFAAEERLYSWSN